jgi:hypothetical protein
MRSKLVAALALAALCSACGDDAGTGTTEPPATVEEYCAILAGAHERASEETIDMLLDLDFPGAAAVLEPIERREVSAEDFQALADYNLATCGVEFP